MKHPFQSSLKNWWCHHLNGLVSRIQVCWVLAC